MAGKYNKSDASYAVKYDPQSIGSTGLKQFGGYVQEEFLRDLRGTNAARVYREMADNDPTVGAIVFAISMLVRNIDWNVQAADDSPEAGEAKEFLEQVMGDMSNSWSSMMSEVCTMFTYGYAPMEIIWKKRLGPDYATGEGRSLYDDGKIGIRSISLRAQNTINRWEIDPVDGGIDGLWQQPWSGAQVCIPIEKLLLFRTTDEKGNPEGRSILRTAYRPWFFNKRIEEIEAIGIERDLAGLPVVYVPGHLLSADASSDERATAEAFKKMVRQIKRDQQEGIVLPSTRDPSGNLMFDLKLLATGGSRQMNTTAVVDRYAKRIATSVMADFLFLGQSATGSFALSSDKTALFATAIGAFTTSIADVFNRHLIPRLWKLNGLDFEQMPSLQPGDIEKPDIAALGEFISKLTAAGATLFPDRELENFLRKAAGIPPAPEALEEGGIDPRMQEKLDQMAAMGLNPDGSAPGAPADDEEADATGDDEKPTGEAASPDDEEDDE